MENRNTPHSDNPSARAKPQPPENADLVEDEANDATRDTPSLEHESTLQLGGDTGFDRIVGPDEAGLGGGLDQAEEARLGVTDEELAKMKR